MIVHYMEVHGYRPPEQFRDGLHATAEPAWDDRADRLRGLLLDTAEDLEFRCKAITELPHWRHPAAFEALLQVAQDDELVDIAGDQIGMALAAYEGAPFATDLANRDLPSFVRLGMGAAQ